MAITPENRHRNERMVYDKQGGIEKRKSTWPDGPPEMSRSSEQATTLSPIHIPYNVLTSADIKLGYFDSSVIPSSDRAKE